MRPRQWTKNFFVFAGLLFTLDRYHPTADFIKVALAFALFCILSGGIYLFNDIQDANRDRKHPVKSRRPIASGELSERAASTASLILLAAGLTGSFLLDAGFAGIALLYVALLIAYSLFLKDVAILDVMTIAGGFVLRAAGGAMVIHVAISPWLLICTILLALFLGLAKRREELVRLKGASGQRSCLAHYSVPFLDQLIGITAASTIIAYALYTFFSQTGSSHPYMMATLPFVIYGVFRYLLLLHRNAGAESPELLVLSDKPLLIDIVLWAAACVLIVRLG